MDSMKLRPGSFGIVKEIPGEPVPHSNVRALVDYWAESSDPALIVRCGDCGNRLYDARPRVLSMGESMHCTTCYALVRKCPKCKQLNTRDVTDTDGERVGDSGRWLCNCGAFLAEVQAPRGRVKVPCRCGSKTVLSIPRAVKTLSIPF